MAEDRIDSIILLAAIEKEFATVTGFLNKLKTDLSSIPPLKTVIENANAPRDLAAGTEKLATAQKNVAAAQQTVINGQGKLAQMQQAYDGTIKSLNTSIEANINKQNVLKDTIKKLTDEQKRLKTEFDKTKGLMSNSGTDEYKAKQNDLTKVLLRNKQTLADVNAELKDQIKLQFAAPGSIKEAKVQNAQLTRLRDNSQDAGKINELNAAIDRNNDLIDANSDKLGKQKINIGNYQGAANSIVEALGKQEAKLQNLGSAYTSFGSQIATQKNIISGFAGNINSPEYKKATDKLKTLEEGYKNTGIEVAKTRTVVDGFRRVAAVSTQDFTTAAAAQKALSNEAKNIGAAFGTNSEVFKEVNKVVGSSTQEFDKVSKAVDASGKNANVAGGAFKKAFSGLRTLANIIPGIGISGLLLFAIGPIIDFIKYLTISTKTLFGYGEQLKLINKINDEAAVSGGKMIADLQIQKSAIENTLVPMATRLQAIKDIKAEFPDYFAGISTESLLNGQAAAAYDLAAAAIIRKARAQAAASEIEKIAGENLKIQLDQILKAEDTNKKIREAKDVTTTRRGTSDNAGTQSTNTAASQKFALEEQFKAQDAAAKKIVDLNNKKINVLIKLTDFGAKETIKIENNKAAKTDGSLSGLKEKKDTTFEQDKVRLERQLRLLDADIKDEKTYYLDKLNLLEEYGIKSKELLEKQAAEDIKNKNAEKDREVANLNDSKKGKSGSQVARINQNIAIVEKNNAQEIELINVKLVDDLLKNEERRLAGKKDILKAQLKIEEEFSKDQIDLIEVQNKIIDKIRKKQIAEELKDEKDKADKKIKLEKDINDAKKRLQQEAVETIKAFVTDGFDKETMGLDERKRLLDEDTARRINQINLLGLTEMERTRQTAIVQKEANFQNEQIEKRKRQIALERAKFEKAASIASIIANTAKAIVESLPNIPLSLLVGGIGLLQLTRAISTPLPRYKDGRGKGKDEMAIVGDGGKHEYIMRGNGLIEQTPRTDTLTRLMPNDVVFKDNNALLNAMLNASNPYLQIKNIKPNNNEGFSRNDINKLIRAVEKERTPKISIHNSVPIESTAYYQHHIKN